MVNKVPNVAQSFVIVNAWKGVSGVNTWAERLGRDLIGAGVCTYFMSGEITGSTAGAGFVPMPENPFDWHWSTSPYHSRKLADRIGQIGPVTLIPNYSVLAYVAALRLRQKHPEAVRILGYAHSDDPYYYELLETFAPVVDAFVAVSEEVAESLRQKLPQRADSIHVRSYSTDVPKLLNRKSSTGALRLLYSGRIVEEQKRVSRLPLLLQILAERGIPVDMRVLGEGSGELALREACRKLPPNIRVTFAGRVGSNEVPTHLLESDALVLVSDYEGTSLAMLEAMAHGCVPVVTNVSGVKSIIKNGLNGYACSLGNLDEMAECLARLHRDRNQLAQISANAHGQALSDFSHDQYLHWLFDLNARVWQQPPRLWPVGHKIPFQMAWPEIVYRKLVNRQFGIRTTLRSLLRL